MTVDYSKRSFFQFIPHSTAKTASVEVHIVTPNDSAHRTGATGIPHNIEASFAGFDAAGWVERLVTRRQFI
jgi:hypothetical protein